MRVHAFIPLSYTFASSKGMRSDAVYIYNRLASLARTLFSAWTSSVSSDLLYSWFSGFASPSFSKSSSILLNSLQNLPFKTCRTK